MLARSMAPVLARVLLAVATAIACGAVLYAVPLWLGHRSVQRWGEVGGGASGDRVALWQACGIGGRLWWVEADAGEAAEGPGVDLPEPLIGLARGDGQGQAAGFGARGVYLLGPQSGEVRRLWEAEHQILDLIWVRPRAGETPRLVVLTAETVGGPQPLGSHVLLLDPRSPETARRLSPESGYNFWHAGAGDVDDDGRQELALCTFSHTARDPRYARRFFVYGWDEEEDLYPRWRGSRLCRPYRWAELLDVDGDGVSELVSVETGLGGGELLCTYQWNQFGFWGTGHSDEYRGMTPPQVGRAVATGEPVLVTTVVERGRARTVCAFVHRDNAWKLSRRSRRLRGDERLIVAQRTLRRADAPTMALLHSVIPCGSGAGMLRDPRMKPVEGGR